MTDRKNSKSKDIESQLQQPLIEMKDLSHTNAPSKVYNPHQMPADIDMAQKHGIAKRVYKAQDLNWLIGKKLCPCCGLPEDGGELLPLKCDPEELLHLGPGYVLYFTFFKNCILILVLIFIISGAYNLVTNLTSKDCLDLSELVGNIPDTSLVCVRNIVGSLHLAAKKDHPHEMALQAQLNLMTIVVLIIYFQSIRYKIRKVVSEVDEFKVSPADYSLMFLELPTDPFTRLSSDEGIKEWIESLATPEHPIIVKKVSRAFEVAELVKLEEEKEELDKQIRNLGEAGDNEENKHMINELEEKIREQRKKKAKFLGIAFVSFGEVDQMLYVEKYFKKNIIQDYLFKLRRIVHYSLMFGSMPFSQDSIEVKKAPEPTDIEWGNLHFTIYNKLVQRTKVFFLMMLIVAIDFFLVYYVTYQTSHMYFSIGTEYQDVKNMILNTVSASIVIGLDTILEMICLGISKWEIHHSKSNYAQSTCSRISFYSSLNLILPVMLAYIGVGFLQSIKPILKGDIVEERNFSVPYIIYGDGGIMTTMTFVFWFEPLKNFLLNFFDPCYYMKLNDQRRAINSKGADLKQCEAHELFEGPGSSMEKRFGCLVAAILMNCFFAPAFPLALVFAIIGQTLQYWADKYQLLRRWVLPDYLGPQIQLKCIGDLESVVLFFAFGATFFPLMAKPIKPDPSQQVAIYTYSIQITIAVLYKFFLPMNLINESMFPIKRREALKHSYDENKVKFLTDYDIENPATRAEKLAERMKLTLEKVDKENQRIEREKNLKEREKNLQENNQSLI